MDKVANKYIAVSYQLYTVEDEKKSLVEQTQQGRPFQFISGFGVSLDAFERQVVLLQPGEKFEIKLLPGEAFGEYDEDGVRTLAREMFVVDGKFDSANIYNGAVITLTDEEEHRFMARVTDVSESGVTVDINHPLAGETLLFTGVVLENRDATTAEIEHMLQRLSCECSGCDDCGGCDGDDNKGQGGCCGHCHG